MIQPEELKTSEPLKWSAGTGTGLWELFRRLRRRRHGDDQPAVDRRPDPGPQPSCVSDAALFRRARESNRRGRIPARTRCESDRPAYLTASSISAATVAMWTWNGCWRRSSSSFTASSPRGEAIAQAIRDRDLRGAFPARCLARTLARRRSAFQSTDPLGRDDQAARSDRRTALARSRHQCRPPGWGTTDPAHQWRLPFSRLARRPERCRHRRPPRCSTICVHAAPT